MRATWARHEDVDCLLVEGVEPGDPVVVRAANPVTCFASPGMAGRYVQVDGGVCFVPRFPFMKGTTYTVEVDGIVQASLAVPESDRDRVTNVVGICPTAQVIPRNLLRLYVWFSARMSEGGAYQQVRLVDESGASLDHALLPLEHELWDRQRRRLTILLDPARIKRGLVAHREIGYPLVQGQSIRLVVDPGFLDAEGVPLREGAERAYRVGPDERLRVDPEKWDLQAPGAGTVEPVHVNFHRSLDHALLVRCLHVEGPDQHRIRGLARIGSQERSWSFRPEQAWAEGPYHLIVDPVLEDVAGNSVRRVFDRDLDREEELRVDVRRMALPLPIG